MLQLDLIGIKAGKSMDLRHFALLIAIFTLILSSVAFAEPADGNSSGLRAIQRRGATCAAEFIPELAVADHRLAERAQNLVNTYFGKQILIYTDSLLNRGTGLSVVMDILNARIPELVGATPVFVTPASFRNQFNIQIQGQTSRQAIPTDREVMRAFRRANPAAVHVMTELAVGQVASRTLNARGIPFTTAYHTTWPEVFSSRVPEFLRPTVEFLTRGILRDFHTRGSGVMVPTRTLMQGLIRHRMGSELNEWSHGVDLNMFHPSLRDPNLLPRLAAEQGKTIRGPVFMMVARISNEKNIEDFLNMNVRGTKVFVGPGEPSVLAEYQRRYPDVLFLGRRDHDTEMPTLFASADVFVFTGYSETYGLVMGEALASGTPVLAYDVQGPRDIVTDTRAGTLVDFQLNDTAGNVRRLEQAVAATLLLDRNQVRRYAETISWDKSVIEFLELLIPLEHNIH